MNKNKEWEKEFEGRLTNAGLSREMVIMTIIAIRSLISQAEDNMRKRCLEIIKGHSIDKKEITKLYKQGYGASSAECEERNDFIDELVDEIDALDQATQNINNLDKE